MACSINVNTFHLIIILLMIEKKQFSRVNPRETTHCCCTISRNRLQRNETDYISHLILYVIQIDCKKIQKVCQDHTATPPPIHRKITENVRGIFCLFPFPVWQLGLLISWFSRSHDIYKASLATSLPLKIKVK